MLDPDFDYLVAGPDVSAIEIQEYLKALYSSSEFEERLAAMKKKFDSYVENSIESHLDYYDFILQKTE